VCTNFTPGWLVAAQVLCKWCGRKFSHPAAKQHIPFCEKWTKEHGTPLNPASKPTARDANSKNQKAKEVGWTLVLPEMIQNKADLGCPSDVLELPFF